MADDQAAAQAVELVRALCDQLHAMTRRLARLERQGVTGTNGRASAAVRTKRLPCGETFTRHSFSLTG
jgi:hypothetical protein